MIKSQILEDSKAYLLTVKRPLYGLTIHNKTEKGGLFIYLFIIIVSSSSSSMYVWGHLWLHFMAQQFSLVSTAYCYMLVSHSESSSDS